MILNSDCILKDTHNLLDRKTDQLLTDDERIIEALSDTHNLLDRKTDQLLAGDERIIEALGGKKDKQTETQLGAMDKQTETLMVGLKSYMNYEA